MILLITSESDSSTNDIIDWLIYYGVDFLRVNGEEQFKLLSFVLTNHQFECKLQNVYSGETLDLQKVSAIWYRRGDINILNNAKQKTDFAGVRSFIHKEYVVLHDFIMNIFEGLPRIDSYYRRSMNKLDVLSIAKSVGLLIPNTYLFEGVFPTSFNGSYITKSIFEVFKYETAEGYYTAPTTLIHADDIITKGHTYSLSKVQEHLEKECDVRVFCLCGEVYPMAIMSQNNEKSKVDFRHYPKDPPNRSFAIKLPDEITTKLKDLMDRLMLDSGSIDLVLDRKGRFYFLEVNPVGQFGMTSSPCNYLLEREVAKQLISRSRILE